MKTRKMMAESEEDRLSDLPDSVRLYILSLLADRKEITRTSVLSKQWQCLWKSVPVSLCFCSEKFKCNLDIADFVDCSNRELLVLRSFHDIPKFSVYFRYESRYDRDVNLWVYFATQFAIVKDFTLIMYDGVDYDYEFPQFAFKNSSLKNLKIRSCILDPPGSVTWSSLVSLSIGDLVLRDGVMEKVLSGCPNLECLELDSFCGIKRLEISSLKLRKLIIGNTRSEWIEKRHQLEIFAPYVQNLQINHKIFLRLKNVASLVTAALNFYLEFDDYKDDCTLVKTCRYLKELLHSLVHVKNLELGPWCIEFLSILVLKGWQSPASSRRFLTLNTALVQQDFPAICSLLQSSPDLETMVIDWTKQTSRDLLLRFINEDENGRMFEKHIFDCSLLHLRTVKIINYYGPLRANRFIIPLVKHLLKNAEVLEKMIIAANLRYNKFQGSDVSQDFVEMAEEFLSFPRSSQNAVVVFSHR